MARRLRFGRLIPDDLLRAVEYYDRHSLATGNRFRKAVDGGLDQIERIADAMPFVWPGQPYRFYRLRRFPCLIFFRIDETTAYLPGVVHTASDPSGWIERSSAILATGSRQVFLCLPDFVNGTRWFFRL